MTDFYNNLKKENKKIDDQNNNMITEQEYSECVRLEIAPHCIFNIHIPNKETRDMVVEYFKERFKKPQYQPKYSAEKELIDDKS